MIWFLITTIGLILSLVVIVCLAIANQRNDDKQDVSV